MAGPFGDRGRAYGPRWGAPGRGLCEHRWGDANKVVLVGAFGEHPIGARTHRDALPAGIDMPLLVPHLGIRPAVDHRMPIVQALLSLPLHSGEGHRAELDPLHHLPGLCTPFVDPHGQETGFSEGAEELLLLEGARDTATPEDGIALQMRRHRLVGDDVGDGYPPAG